ncbi:hypothetical protein GHV77_17605, partial [Pseudomonas aeruginosa]|nr:hypothetical protein [Pseudomonas aeruginosa]
SRGRLLRASHGASGNNPASAGARRAAPGGGAARSRGAAACGGLPAQRPAAGTADCRERLD